MNERTCLNSGEEPTHMSCFTLLQHAHALSCAMAVIALWCLRTFAETLVSAETACFIVFVSVFMEKNVSRNAVLLTHC